MHKRCISLRVLAVNFWMLVPFQIPLHDKAQILYERNVLNAISLFLIGNKI